MKKAKLTFLKNHDFVKHGKWHMLASAIIVFIGIIIISIFGLNLGLEFTKGNLTEIKIGPTLSDNKNFANYKKTVESIFSENGVAISALQRQGEADSASIIIKYQNKKGAEVKKTVSKIEKDIISEFSAKHGLEVTKDDVNTETTKSANSVFVLMAALAAGISIILMLFYIWFRFDIWSGLCIIIGIIHDVLIAIALTGFFRIPVNSAFVAAIATILGYSTYNSIVLFDRIRESYFKDDEGKKWKELVNNCIKGTLARTFYIFATAFVVMLMLIIMGVPDVKEFALVIIFGIVACLYSSIFIVGSAFAFIADKRNIKFKKRFKKTVATGVKTPPTNS